MVTILIFCCPSSLRGAMKKKPVRKLLDAEMNPQAIAAGLLVQVLVQKRSLSQVLDQLPKVQPSLSLIKMLCFGVLRWYLRLEKISQELLATPLKSKNADLHLLLLVGLFQLLYLNMPKSMAVTQTVEAARFLGKSWATRLLNGSLRHFLRQEAVLTAQTDHSPDAYFSHPDWLINKIQQAYPERWESILAANNQQPPLHLRVNQRKVAISAEALISDGSCRAGNPPCSHAARGGVAPRVTRRPEDYRAGIADLAPATMLPHCSFGLWLKTPCEVALIPGFAEGLCSVQDGAAQLAAPLLNLEPRQRVLDACSAPGGKTAHIAEIQPAVSMVAIDAEASRLQKAQDNWQRLGLESSIQWLVGRAEEVDSWWDGQLFERILLDAPCSATGVIRRHPDIKWLRTSEDIGKLRVQQEKLLNALWPLLKEGGLLLYATCSILPEENDQVIEAFLAAHPDAKIAKIEADWGQTTAWGRQILPGIEDMDGFYYARLIKDLSDSS